MEVQTGNQQAKTISEVERGWLAGFLDGEGHIGFVSNVGPKRSQIQPRVILVGTHPKGLEYLTDVLTRAELGYYIHWPKDAAKKAHWKPKWTVTILGFKRCQRLFDLVGTDLQIKREQADAVLGFIAGRPAHGDQGARRVYSDADLALVERVRTLNNRPKP